MWVPPSVCLQGQGNARALGVASRSRAGLSDRPRAVVRSLLVLTLLSVVSWLSSPTALAAPHEGSFGDPVSSVTTSGSVPSSDVVVFTDRDTVRVDGFAERAGQTGLVEVVRDGRVVGSARGAVSGRGAAFTVGAAGGPCWDVPVDLRPGDLVSLSFGAVRVAQTVAGAVALAPTPTLAGAVLQVSGRIGPGAEPGFLEQRVVTPALAATTIGRSDVRAVPGPLRRAARGGYSSQLVVAGTTVTATYVFDDPAAAALAASGSSRLMSWQSEGPAGDRHGQTVTEPAAVPVPAACAAPAPATPAAPAAALTPDGVVLAVTPGTEVYFTVDGTSPRLLDLPAAGAARYVPPIVVTRPATTISWVAVGPDGATSEVAAVVVDPPR